MITLIKSHLNNPYQNLAIEELIFKTLKEDEIILFLYINSDSVIIGRHQNPFLETNPYLLQKDNIPLVRRVSGGGAVFHDVGNINFSFISFAKKFDKKFNFNIIINSLKKIGINNITKGDRDDLYIDNFKISGSSFYNLGEKRVHHGTILVNSNLDNLKKYLTPMFDKFDGNYIESKRSKTVTIHDILLKNKNILVNSNDILLKKKENSIFLESKSYFINNSNNFSENKSDFSENKNLINTILVKIEESMTELISIKDISDVFPYILDFNYINILEKYQSFNWNFQKTPKFKFKEIEINPSKIDSLEEFFNIFS